MGKRNCDETITRVYPYLDGEITWYRRMRVRFHLRNCHDCSDGFAFEQRLLQKIRESSHSDPPAEFMERLRDYFRNPE